LNNFNKISDYVKLPLVEDTSVHIMLHLWTI